MNHPPMPARLLSASLICASLLAALLLAPAALAQTPPTPVTTLRGTLTLKVPAGAKTLVIARSGSEAKLVELPGGATRIVLSLNLRPKLYRDSYTVQGVSVGGAGLRETRGSSEGVYSSDGNYAVSPFKTTTLNPPLNTWTTLWQGTQKSSTSFSFSLNGKKMSGSASPDTFRVQVLFSTRPAGKIDPKIQPPRLP